MGSTSISASTRAGTSVNTNTLQRLFPSRQIDRDGLIITIRPLTLSQLPLIVDAFTRVVGLKSDGQSDTDIVFSAIDDILRMVSLVCDTPTDEIPVSLAPEIALTFLEQNLSADVMGKWRALVVEATAILGGGVTVTATQTTAG